MTDLDFVDEIGEFKDGNSSFSFTRTDVAPAQGRCRVAKPDIGGLLPVYVYDDYPGFTVKRFVDLADDELDAYTKSNFDALTAAIRKHQPEVIITGHEVMGPEIARQACEAVGGEYIAKLHGSALEYAVKEQDRYLQHAKSGLGSAKRVVGGSEYMVAEAARAIPGWEQRAAVVNPGCDVDLFRPRKWKDSQPSVGYVGKLMAAKGVHHLLAALPLVPTRDVHAVIVGYGGFDEGLRDLATALQKGDVDAALAVATAGESAELKPLTSFLKRIRKDPEYWNRARSEQIEFTGRLEHRELAEVLPDMDVLCVPSVVPEAFGMVAAEAAACGVLPLVPDHSGIAEVGGAIEEELGRPGFLTFKSKDPIRSIAAGIERILSLPTQERDDYESIAVEVARRRWSWSHTAKKLLELA